MEKIIARRGRAEDASAVKFWKSVSVPSKFGLIADADFQLWIDWLVRDGQLAAGQVVPRAIYSNVFNDAASSRETPGPSSALACAPAAAGSIDATSSARRRRPAPMDPALRAAG